MNKDIKGKTHTYYQVFVQLLDTANFQEDAILKDANGNVLLFFVSTSLLDVLTGLEQCA
jgi:hypothetical protein